MKYTYNSQLLTYYAFFESWLKKLCDCHHKLGFNRITVSDLTGRNYIEKSKLYFEKVADLQLGGLKNEWVRIQILQQIRNLIVHNNSNIIKSADRLISKQPQFQIISKEKFINLDESTGVFYIKEKEFLFEVLDLFQLYLTKIILMIDKPKVVIKSSELPSDMGNWGIEKVERLIQSTIRGIWQLENCKLRKDEFRYSDTIANGIGNYKSMNWNLTKLLSLFSGSTWDTVDYEIINNKGEIGLSEIKEKYKILDLSDLDIENIDFNDILF